MKKYVDREREIRHMCNKTKKAKHLYDVRHNLHTSLKNTRRQKKTQGWLFSGKVQICGHTAWFALLYHVDIHARSHY